MNLEIGEVVGEYEVVQEIGGGGIGCVYKVEHTITKRIEAIKVLAGAVPSTEEQRRRFHREIQVHARLAHPNIAAVHNAFWVGDNLVMVMEYLEGRPLQQLIEEGRVRPEDGIRFVRQVLDALAHAHAQGVVHRDVSPANIVVGPGGQVKLTDFGLAKGQMDAPITTTGALVGSLCYMSPEQVRGTVIPDARSDIYSCGVVLYEVCTGRKPFASNCAFTLMRAHVELAPVPPAMVNAGLPPLLNDVILRALAKDPADRFQTAGDFRASLDMIAPPEPGPVTVVPAAVTLSIPVPVAAPPVPPPAIPALQGPPPVGSLMRLVRSQAVGILLGALFMTAVLGAVFWTGEIPRVAPAAPPPAVASAPVPAVAPPPASSPSPLPEPVPPAAAVPVREVPLESPAAPAEVAAEIPDRRAETAPLRLDGAERKTTAPRIGNLGPAPARLSRFRPPASSAARREVSLPEPPPLAVAAPAPGGPGFTLLQPFPAPSQETPLEAPPPPNKHVIRRFLGKVRGLNPLRPKQPAPDAEK